MIFVSMRTEMEGIVSILCLVWHGLSNIFHEKKRGHKTSYIKDYKVKYEMKKFLLLFHPLEIKSEKSLERKRAKSFI